MKTSARERLFKLLCSILIMALPVTGYSGSPLQDDLHKTDPSVKRALEKSLIFPGWGQIQEKQYAKGILFAVSELAAITGALISNRQGNRSYRRYQTAVTGEDATFWREETVTYDRRRNLFMAAGAGIWILNMLDIYLYQKKRGIKKVSVALSPGIKDEISLHIGYCF